MLGKDYIGDTYKKYKFVDDIEDIQKLIEFIMGTPEVLKHIKTYGMFAIVAMDKNMFTYIELVKVEKKGIVDPTSLLTYILDTLGDDCFILGSTIDLLEDYSSCISSVERFTSNKKALVYSIDYVNIERNQVRTETTRCIDVVRRIYYLLKDQSWVTYVSIQEDIRAMRLAKMLLDYYADDDLGMDILLHGHLPLLIKKDWYWCNAIRIIHLPKDSYEDGLDFDKVVSIISRVLLGTMGDVEWVDKFSFDATKNYLQDNDKLIRKLLSMFDGGDKVVKLAYQKSGHRDRDSSEKYSIVNCELEDVIKTLWCEEQRPRKLIGVEVEGNIVPLEQLLV